MEIHKILEWEKNVSEYLKTLKEKLDKNDKAKNLYNGFYIWDSKFIYRPKIMFIGINPGNGNPNNSKKIITSPEAQMSYLEYLDGENESYTLARETIEVFKEIGYSNEEIRNLFNDDSVKTNFYFIITGNQSQIKECLKHLNFENEFEKKSFDFIGELIQIVNPKYIICEGKSVFDKVKEFYLADEYEEIWKEDFGMLKIKESELIYFGYKRNLNRHNNIKDIKGFANFIKPYLKK